MAELKDSVFSGRNNVMLRESNIELQNDIDIESRHWCTRKVFNRKTCAIFCGLLYYFLLGVEETVMSAYFSVVAKKRGFFLLNFLAMPTTQTVNFLIQQTERKYMWVEERKTFTSQFQLPSIDGKPSIFHYSH